MSDPAIVDQLDPSSSDDDVSGAHELACRDLMARAELGLRRYGAKLHPNNGRSNVIDLYQEVLDLVAYARNLISQLELNDPAEDRAVLLPNGRIAMRCSAPNGEWHDDDPQAWKTTDPISYPNGEQGLQVRWLRDSEIPLGSIPLIPALSLDPTNTIDSPDDLYEMLAAVEHERWASWQSYVHSVGERQLDGSIVLPPERVQAWERLISIPYSQLSNDQKDNDRLEVSKYWELIFGTPYICTRQTEDVIE